MYHKVSTVSDVMLILKVNQQKPLHPVNLTLTKLNGQLENYSG